MNNACVIVGAIIYEEIANVRNHLITTPTLNNPSLNEPPHKQKSMFHMKYDCLG